MDGTKPKIEWRAVTSGVLKAAAIALFVQALYWLVLDPSAFSPAPAGTMIETDGAAFAELPEPTIAALSVAQFKPAELPIEQCCEPGYFAARVTFDLPAVPESGLGLGPRLDAENYMIVVNGGIVYNPGRMKAPTHSFHGMDKRPVHVPAASLRQGANVVDVIMTNSAIPILGFRGVNLGEYHEFVRGGRHRNFMIYDYRMIGGIIAGILALLALVLIFRSAEREFALWLFALASTWSALNLQYSWYDWPFGAPAQVLFRFALLVLLPLAWLNLIDSWTGCGIRWVRWGLAAIFGVALLVWTPLLLSDSVSWYLPSIEFLEWWAWALGIASITRVVWHLFTRREDRYWELALLILCVTAMIVDTFDAAGFHVSNSAPILFLALAVAFIARNIRLFRSMNEFNALLAGQLKEREAELAGQYARQEELARRETLVGERQRLMRDMHDGIGGQLMGLLFASRRQPIPQAELTESLQLVIDELRLIIDSLDTVGETLGTALATFRARIEPKLSAAGIELRWSNMLPDTIDNLGAREVLQIFRIVQEAVTNVIRHANSPTIDINIGVAETGAIQIEIADAGSGMGAANENGHGMENMKMRAAAIDGSIKVESSPRGSTITLLVPLKPVAAA
jgi:two-component system, NarL family, sensor histidine kinase UhpB